jgi:hypothetical protein
MCDWLSGKRKLHDSDTINSTTTNKTSFLFSIFFLILSSLRRIRAYRSLFSNKVKDI